MAVPTIVGASATANWVGGGGSGATLLADMPTVQPDDLVVLVVFVRAGGQTIDLTSGYTQISGDNDNPAGTITSEVQAKIAGPSESDPSVHTSVTDTQPTGAVIVTVRGWSGDIADLAISAVASGANNTPLAPDATPTVNDTLTLRIYVQHDDNTVTTPPAGHTQVFAELTLQGSDANMAVFSRNAGGQAGVGVGSAAPTMSGSDPWSAYTLLIPPSTGGSTITGTAAASLTVTAPAAGTRTGHGTAFRSATFTVTASGRRTVHGASIAPFVSATAATGRRTVRAAAALAAAFTATAAAASSRVTRPYTGTITRPFSGVVTRP